MKKLDEINQELEELEERHSNKINKFILADFLLLVATMITLYGALLGNALFVVQ